MSAKIFDLVTLTLKFDLLLKSLNLGHSFLTRRDWDFIWIFLVARPFHGYQNFWPSNLEVWPFKNFNLGHSFLTRGGWDFICTFPVTRPFHGYQNFWPWPWSLTYFKKNFYLSHRFLTRRGRAFIFHICIPCSKTFGAVPWFLTYWSWPCKLTYFKKKIVLDWLLNQRRYLLLLFTYGYCLRAMLSFWQLWFWHVFFGILVLSALYTTAASWKFSCIICKFIQGLLASPYYGGLESRISNRNTLFP